MALCGFNEANFIVHAWAPVISKFLRNQERIICGASRILLMVAAYLTQAIPMASEGAIQFEAFWREPEWTDQPKGSFYIDFDQRSIDNGEVVNAIALS